MKRSTELILWSMVFFGLAVGLARAPRPDPVTEALVTLALISCFCVGMRANEILEVLGLIRQGDLSEAPSQKGEDVDSESEDE